MKARERTKNRAQDPFLKELDKRTAADTSAVNYALRKLRKETVYMNDDSEGQLRREEEKRREVMHKRYITPKQFLSILLLIATRKIDGKDAKKYAWECGLGEDGGLYSQWEDGNPAWEDEIIDAENELEFEALWREDDRALGETNKTIEVDEEESRGAIMTLIYKVSQSLFS